MSVTARELRSVMARFATGVTVLTTYGGGQPHAMTANAFSSLSLTPPLVLACISKSATMCGLLCEDALLGVSILGAGQEVIARRFATKSRPRGWPQFNGLSWWGGEQTGVPLLGGAAAWLECRVTDVFPGGDHVIVVGRVLSCSEGRPGTLTFVEGAFESRERPAASLERST